MQNLKRFLFPFMFLVVLGLWAYLTFASTFVALDEGGVLAFRNETGVAGPEWMLGFMKIMTHIGGSAFLIVISVLALAWLIVRREKRLALCFIGVVGGAFALTPLLKQMFGRARPDIVEHLVHASSPSFPSGHALRSAVVYLTLLYLARLFVTRDHIKNVLHLFAFTGIILIGISRIYLGVHWPTDIVAGWLFAAFWLTLWHRIYTRA